MCCVTAGQARRLSSVQVFACVRSSEQFYFEFSCCCCVVFEVFLDDGAAISSSVVVVTVVEVACSLL